MANQLLKIIIGKQQQKRREKHIFFRNYRTGTVLIQCQWHHKFEQTRNKSSQFYSPLCNIDKSSRISGIKRLPVRAQKENRQEYLHF